MELQRIAEAVSLADDDSVKNAMSRMRTVPEHQLHFYLVLRDTLQATTPDTRKAITLAQVEADRRAMNRMRFLTVSTTVLSGVVGLVGVVLGAYLVS